MHFKKLLSVTVLATSLMISMPAVVHADEPADSTGQTANGWSSDASGSFYVTPDGKKATGFCTIDGKVYYFDADGYLFKPASGGVMTISKKLYYFSADGTVKTGLFSVKTAKRTVWYYAGSNYQLFTGKTLSMNGKVYCFGEDGQSLGKGLHKLNGKKYLTDNSGIAKTGRQKYNGKVYFFGSDGAMIVGKVTYNGKLYFTKKNGVLAKKGWVTSGKKTYYVNSDGTLQTGWKKYKKKWYYLNKKTGARYTNKWVTKNGKKCRLGSDGSLQTGWFKVNGKKYYGTLTGNDIGARYTGVHQLKNKIYVFGSDGALGNGWTVYGSRKYYANSKGEITRGWKKIGKNTYFFNDYGAMHTGWLCYNGKYYYLNPSNGAMVKGTKTIDGKTYIFSSSGVSNRDLEGSWTVKVNRQQNVVTVYKGGVPVRAMICSTGVNNATPTGTFSIMDKLYTYTLNGPTYGYYCSHITSDILFHSIPQPELGRKNLPAYKYNMLGNQASEGCIRLSISDAYWLYNNVPTGSTVIVYDSPNPGPLGKPKGIKIPTSQNYDPTDPLYFNTGK